MSKRSVFLFSVLLIGVGSAIALAAAGRTVYYHDQVMTQDARQIDGRTYVPLSDVAHALGAQVASRGDGFAIVTGGSGSSTSAGSRTAAGGANEVRGANGNVGDWFFNGLWRFRVSKVERTDEYNFQFAASPENDKPSGGNDELVVCYCTIKNGHAQTEEPVLTSHGLASQNTALTDDQGQSYAPIDFDVRGGGLTPGAAKNFAVVFSVPKGTKIKDLIFTLYGFATSTKASNVRVNLAGQ
jgi:hypothetical protein